MIRVNEKNPFFILDFLNVRRQISIERRLLDRQITAMILLHVIFFVLFTLPSIVHRIYVVNVSVS